MDLGLLIGDVDGIIERGDYRHLYMHRTGHWLGLDVHDVGAYRLGEQPAPLEPGMVLTVEPGLYVSDRLTVPEGQPEIDNRWKGIGIRIEDDVAVLRGIIEGQRRRARIAAVQKIFAIKIGGVFIHRVLLRGESS